MTKLPEVGRTKLRGAQACALACPGLRCRRWWRDSVRDAEPAADAGALDRLVLWALQCYAPIVAAGRAGDRGDRLSPLSPSADSRMFYDILKGMSGARRSGPVGDSSTLEQRTLTPSILVRIQVPKPRILPPAK